jgi:DNA polymerase elongation subunit (family B)
MAANDFISEPKEVATALANIMKERRRVNKQVRQGTMTPLESMVTLRELKQTYPIKLTPTDVPNVQIELEKQKIFQKIREEGNIESIEKILEDIRLYSGVSASLDIDDIGNIHFPYFFDAQFSFPIKNIGLPRSSSFTDEEQKMKNIITAKNSKNVEISVISSSNKLDPDQILKLNFYEKWRFDLSKKTKLWKK